MHVNAYAMTLLLRQGSDTVSCWARRVRQWRGAQLPPALSGPARRRTRVKHHSSAVLA